VARGPALDDRRTLAGFLLLVALIGTNLVAIRYSNRELDPFWNAGLRFAIAAVLFAALAAVRGAAMPSPRGVAGAMAYGGLSVAAFFGFLYLGLVQATAALGQTVLALGPLITLFLAAAVGQERLHVRPVVGAVVSVTGIGIAFGAQSALDVPLTSLLAIVAAATSFAAGGIVAKGMPRTDPYVQNALGMTVGAVLLLAMSALAGERWALPETPGTWVAFVYLVLPGTLATFLLLLALLRRWPASSVAYQFILAPIVSISLGALLLGEPVGPGVLAGAGLVIVGVWIGALARTD
jgi:drug/metabolite transporter (DMT)-like permease